MDAASEWRKFLSEGSEDKNIFTYIQGLHEVISNFKPRTIKEDRRLTLAKQHLREVRRHARKMHNEVMVLQEKLNILEESLNEGR